MKFVTTEDPNGFLNRAAEKLAGVFKDWNFAVPKINDQHWYIQARLFEPDEQFGEVYVDFRLITSEVYADPIFLGIGSGTRSARVDNLSVEEFQSLIERVLEPGLQANIRQVTAGRKIIFRDEQEKTKTC